MKRTLWLILKLALVLMLAWPMAYLGMLVGVLFSPERDSPWFLETGVATLVIGWTLVLWWHLRLPRQRTGFWSNEVF